MTGTEFVVDASALVTALGADAGAQRTRARLRTADIHAPHLIDAEIGSVLRRHEQGGLLSPDDAVAALSAARMLVGHRYAHPGLSEAAWALRHNLSFYDALYVALAARLAVPLLTSDGRMANAPGVTCTVELV